MQKYLSVLLVSVYAFVVLFSANFHHHSHGFFDADSLIQSGKVLKKSFDQPSANDCVACHFLTAKSGSTPPSFQFEVLDLRDVHIQLTAYVIKNASSEVVLYRLRGPPSFI